MNDYVTYTVVPNPGAAVVHGSIDFKKEAADLLKEISEQNEKFLPQSVLELLNSQPVQRAA